MTEAHTLFHLKPGESGVIRHITAHPDTTHRLMQLGLCPGEGVRVVRLAPLGGPMDIEVMGYRLAIRRSDAAHILLQ